MVPEAILEKLEPMRMGLRTWHTMTCGVKLCSGLSSLTTQIDPGLFNIYNRKTIY